MMKLIKIKANENGSHENQTINQIIKVPDGYAVIPDEMEIPDTFPFVNIEVENGIVTKMTAGIVPEPEPEPIPEPTADELLNALLGVTSYE